MYRKCHIRESLFCSVENKLYSVKKLDRSKETMWKGRVAESSAHSIQCCDWLAWQRPARSSNQNTESSGRTFRLLSLLPQSPRIVVSDVQTCRWTRVKLFLLQNSKLLLISRYSRAQASRRVELNLELQQRRIWRYTHTHTYVSRVNWKWFGRKIS